ncbi:hypothetical protein LY76DRAFT_174963 [Colletotrichum caudatum]|nr:hypothetical protein LY76DRAFT_174963 [Colletotrichum caudatum]
MATPRANEEVLKVILTKLHRLETSFNQISNRLSTIESSVVSDTGSSPVASSFSSLHLASCCCASCLNTQPLQHNRHEGNHEQNAAVAAYKSSVDKLRNKFDLGSISESPSVTHEEDPICSRNSDDRSRAGSDYLVSVRRPSHPAPPHSICYHDTNTDFRSFEPPNSQSEDTSSRAELMERTGLSRSSSVSSLSKPGSFSSAPKHHSLAGTLSGNPCPFWDAQDTIDDTLKSVGGPNRRARSMRSRKTKSSTAQRNSAPRGSTNDTLVVDPTLIRRLEEKEFLRLYKMAQDSARACITLGQRMMHVVNRGGSIDNKLRKRPRTGA